MNQEKAYPLKEGKKPITYDDYYLIFGNSEVRLKSLDSKLFSNFGISNSFFDSRGDRVNELIGEGAEREVEMASFEIHQIEFEH